MGSVGKDETDTKNGGLLNSGFDNDVDVDVDVDDDDDGVGIETQIFDSQWSQSLEEIEVEDLNGHEYQNTLPVEEDETQVLEEETQLLLEEDLDGEENFRTQLTLDECEEQVFNDSDGAGTDTTEVLSDAHEVSEDEFQRGNGVDAVGLENNHCSFLCRKEEKEMVTGSEDLIDERRNSGNNVSTTAPLDKGLGEPKPGFVRKSFMSVRSASLRASGLAAAQRIISKGTDTDPGCIRSNSHSRDEYIHKNKGTTDPAAISKEIMEMDKDCETRSQNGNMQGFKDETKRKSAVRRLFTDDTPPANNRVADDDNFDAGRDFPELPNAQEFAGLSYVESQEPGELSQANALDTVDKFLSVNDVNLSQEVYPGKNVKEKSPSIPSAKGPHILARRSISRSPVCEVGIFDWVDSREDEGGGNFFSKKKEVLLTSQEFGRRSFTQPPKPRHLNFSKGKEKLDKLGEREEDLKFHQKIMGLTRSDSRLMLHNLKKDDKVVQISETKTKKNLFKELDKQINPEPSEQETEARVIRDSPDIYDVGIDTQLAAEAMEALVCGVAANQDNDTTQVSTNTSEDCDRGAVKAKSSSELVFRKKISSDLGRISRKSERLKKLDTKISGETHIPPRRRSKNSDMEQLLTDSGGKTKGKKGRPGSDHQFCNGNAANWYERSDGRSLKSVKKRKAVGVGEKVNIFPKNKDVDKCHSSSTTISRNAAFSKGKLQEECRTNTPIARRTRQSQAVNALTVNLFSGSGEGKNDLTKRETRKRSSMGVDAPELLTVQAKRLKMDTHQTGDVKNNKAKLQESLTLDGPPEKEVTNCYKKTNALSNPRGMVACWNRSGWLNERDQLDGSSKVGDLGETNGRSIGSTCVNLMKRKTRSSIVRNPSTSSEKYFEGNMRQQGAVDPGAVNCSSAATGILVSNDFISEKASMDDDVDSLSSPEVSPRGKVKPSGSACVTPINCTTRINVTTPINEASPLCIGNDYHKQSWKKSLSKSSLLKEFHKLGTDEIPTPVFKSLRKRKDMANVRVLFSHHLDENIIKQQKKILTRMGVSIASSSSEATHFVTDKFVRTWNMLEAIALGKPVVTHLWLESCGQASCYIDEKNYILRDPRKEKEIGFSLPVSLSRACRSPLLEGKRVFITPNLKPDKGVIISLVKAVHGQAMERIGRSLMKDDKVLEELLVLSCEEDYEICVPFLEKGISVYSSELLLNGIVIQTLEYERHRLFNDHVRRTRSTIWFRKEDRDQFKPVVTKRK